MHGGKSVKRRAPATPGSSSRVLQLFSMHWLSRDSIHPPPDGTSLEPLARPGGSISLAITSHAQNSIRRGWTGLNGDAGVVSGKSEASVLSTSTRVGVAAISFKIMSIMGGLS